MQHYILTFVIALFSSNLWASFDLTDERPTRYRHNPYGPTPIYIPSNHVPPTHVTTTRHPENPEPTNLPANGSPLLENPTTTFYHVTPTEKPLSKAEKRKIAQAKNQARQQEENRRKGEKSAATEVLATQKKIQETPPPQEKEKKPEAFTVNSELLETATSNINRTKTMIEKYLRRIQTAKVQIKDVAGPKDLNSRISSFTARIRKLDDYVSQMNKAKKSDKLSEIIEASAKYLTQARKDLESEYAWIEKCMKEQAELEKKREEFAPYLASVDEILANYEAIKVAGRLKETPSGTNNQNLFKLLKTNRIFDLESYRKIEKGMQTLRSSLSTINTAEVRHTIVSLLYMLRDTNKCNIDYHRRAISSLNKQMIVFGKQTEELSHAFSVGEKPDMNRVREIKSETKELEDVKIVLENTYNKLDAWVSDTQVRLCSMRKDMTAPELQPHLASLYDVYTEINQICTQSDTIPDHIKSSISFLLLNIDLASYSLMGNDFTAAYNKIVEIETSVWYKPNNEESTTTTCDTVAALIKAEKKAISILGKIKQSSVMQKSMAKESAARCT